MLSHLILNKLKFWNIDQNAASQTLNGKQLYLAPKQVRVTETIHAGGIMMEFPLVYSGTYDVIGAGNDYYIINAAGADSTEHYDHQDVIISKTDCTPIWGGKTSPSHFWQWIRSLLYPTREVA